MSLTTLQDTQVPKEMEMVVKIQQEICNLTASNWRSFSDLVFNYYSTEDISEMYSLILITVVIRPKLHGILADLWKSIKLKYNFQPSSYTVAKTYPNFLRILFKRGCYTYEEVIEAAYQKRSLFYFFAPEISIEQRMEFVWAEFSKSDQENDWKLFRERIEYGYTLNSIEFSIKNDNLYDLVTFASAPSFSWELPLNFNGNELQLANTSLCLCDFAAVYSSINCFKFILVNQWCFLPSKADYVIEGGNYEIIHYYEQKGINFYHSHFLALRFFHFEVFDWLQLRYPMDSSFDIDFVIKLNAILPILNCFQNGVSKIDCFSFLEWTPLHIACLNNNVSLVRYLIHEGADVNKDNKGKNKPLELCAETDNIALIHTMIENGANLDESTASIIMMNAIFSHNNAIIDYVSKKGVSISQTLCKCTLLISSIENSILSFLRFVLDLNINLNELKLGEPILNIAVRKHNTEVVQMLINKGIDLNNANDSKETALDVAISEDLPEIIRLLENNGGKRNLC